MNDTEGLEIEIVADNPNHVPAYATNGSAGMDIFYPGVDRILYPNMKFSFECGFRIAVPEGYAALIIPRSGLGGKLITIPNSPGLIDSDYRGIVGMILYNQGTDPLYLKTGMRVGQMVVVPVPRVAWKMVKKLGETERGEGGFGSTGTGAIKLAESDFNV